MISDLIFLTLDYQTEIISYWGKTIQLEATSKVESKNALLIYWPVSMIMCNLGNDERSDWSTILQHGGDHTRYAIT